MLRAENSPNIIAGEVTIGGKLKLPTQGDAGGILMGGDVLIYRYNLNFLALGSNDGLRVPIGNIISFRNLTTFIASLDNDHLDLNADVSIDLNTPIVTLGTTDRIQFRDAAIYINSGADGNLDIVADTAIRVNGPLTVTSSIEHEGDMDTYINFTANDILFKAGNNSAFRCNATGIHMFGGTPQAQQAHIIDADGQLADITAKFNTLLADLEGYGLLAAS